MDHYPGCGASIAFVRVETLTKPARLPPDIHIFVQSKPAWLDLPKHVPATSEYYGIEKLWPAASLRRLAGVRESGEPP